MEELQTFRRPSEPDNVHYRIGVIGRQAVMTLAYIDARDVIERINNTGLAYSTEFTELTLDNIPAVKCALTIGELGTRSDVGSFDHVNHDAFGLKAVYSDAFKRAAVHFGIGISLYSHPTSFVSLDKEEKALRFKGDKPVAITDKGEAICRKKYEEWYKSEGKAEFGEYL